MKWEKEQRNGLTWWELRDRYGVRAIAWEMTGGRGAWKTTGEIVRSTTLREAMSEATRAAKPTEEMAVWADLGI